ncbi:hypothetical protein [Streptomyces sp. Caat 7-52]|uniref:hypothetical protein n=1 Tax=Streptomyces sp. Caat 7-52 TaxID=2949637 RepID=UPI0020353CB1|nr:hypothetical protein [Streptomyces sp. Caat 7-52]
MEMAGVVLVLLLTALPVGWCGFQDFSEALTFPGCVTGAFMMVAALIMLVGVVAVVDCWLRGPISNVGVIALIGTAVALLTNVVLLFQTWKNGEKLRYPVLIGLLVLGSLWAVVSVWRRLEEVPTPKRVGLALILPAILAAANFSYQYLYQPSRREAAPLVQLSVGKAMLSEDRKAFSVPVDIKVVNRSDVSFYVLGAEFHAMGDNVELRREDVPTVKWRDEAEKWAGVREKHPLSRREVYQPGQLVAAQQWIPAGNWVEANDESVTRSVVQLAIDTPYDKLAFYATLNLARKDRLVVGGFGKPSYSWKGFKVPKWVGKDGSDVIVQSAEVQENSTIDRRTRKSRRVTTYWRFNPHGVDVSAAIAPLGEEERTPSERTNRDVRNRYGLLDVPAGPVEQPLGEIKSRR